MTKPGSVTGFVFASALRGKLLDPDPRGYQCGFESLVTFVGFVTACIIQFLSPVLGLLDPYVFGPPRSVIQRIRNYLSSCKNSKKNLDSYCFVTS
jgi:hypothetical protein